MRTLTRGGMLKVALPWVFQFRPWWLPADGQQGGKPKTSPGEDSNRRLLRKTGTPKGSPHYERKWDTKSEPYGMHIFKKLLRRLEDGRQIVTKEYFHYKIFSLFHYFVFPYILEIFFWPVFQVANSLHTCIKSTVTLICCVLYFGILVTLGFKICTVFLNMLGYFLHLVLLADFFNLGFYCFKHPSHIFL